MSDVMKGVRILEVAEHTFVPAASAVLADWGADVIKVEHAERGDAMRGLARTGVLDLSKGVHVILEHSNRGKRSIGLDLSKPEGRDALYKIVATCDVFLTNKLPGVLKKLRIDVDDLRAHNPKLIYVRGTAFGPKGPDADRGGYDMTSFWCRAGSAGAIAMPDGDGIVPQPGPAYGDSIGGMTIAGGIAGALFKRERTGEPSVVDVSLLATGAWAMSSALALSIQSGNAWKMAPVKGGGFNPLVGTYATKDGRFVCFVMLQAHSYWADFCEHLGRPELATDERFATAEAFGANSQEASQVIAEEIAKKTIGEWSEIFRTLKGQWAPVQDTLELAADPQMAANGYLASATSSTGVDFQLVASPVQFDEAPTGTSRGPDFNEHGDQVLQEVGLSMDEVLELKAKGAVA